MKEPHVNIETALMEKVRASEREEAWRPEEQGRDGGYRPRQLENRHDGVVGGGPQGSNLFPQAGRLTPLRKLDLRIDDNKIAKNIWQ